MLSDETKQKLIALQLEQDVSRRNRRSTLTENNARKFQAYYDEAITEGKNICVKYIDWYQIRPASLYKNVLDGLKWLILYGTEEERVKYSIFRAKVSFVMSPDPNEGIIIKFRPSGQLVKPKGVSIPDIPTNQSWQEALHTFISDAPTGTKFHMERLNLTLDQKIDIENLFASVNEHRQKDPIIFKVTMDSIKAVK